jgi:hypothetical protein
MGKKKTKKNSGGNEVKSFNNGGEKERERKRAKGKKEVKYKKKKKLLFNCTLCRVSPEGETTLKVNLFFSYHCCAGCVIITHLGTLCVCFFEVCSNSAPIRNSSSVVYIRHLFLPTTV